jgi:hypothetical protein
MGGCPSKTLDDIDGEQPIIKKYDFNENQTSHFEKGEVYYTFNKDIKYINSIKN